MRKHFVIGEQNKELLISSFCGRSQAVETGSEDSCIDSGKDKNTRNCTDDPRVSVQLIPGGAGCVGWYSGGSLKLGYVPGSTTEYDVMNTPPQ